MESALAVQLVVVSRKVADLFCNASVDESEVRLVLSEETNPRTSFKAEFLVDKAAFSERIRFCGARLTSMS